MSIFEYDRTIEEQLNSLICNIDSRPIICLSPVEASSYLGVNMYASEESFHFRVKTKYREFLDYLGIFIQKNSSQQDSYLHLKSTLKRLLSQYENADKFIKEAPERMEWKMQRQFFSLANPLNDYEIDKKIRCTRQAYDFFFKMSQVQRWFLGELISYLSGQIDILKDSGQETRIIEPIYVFVLKEEYSTANKMHQILSSIHKNLKKLGYIECHVAHFKKLFIGFNDPIPEKSPTPIIWKGEHNNHFLFFIQCISNHILARPKSNNIIALKLFYHKTEGNYFIDSKGRFDSRIAEEHKIKIETAIKNSVRYH